MVNVFGIIWLNKNDLRYKKKTRTGDFYYYIKLKILNHFKKTIFCTNSCNYYYRYLEPVWCTINKNPFVYQIVLNDCQKESSLLFFFGSGD